MVAKGCACTPKMHEFAHVVVNNGMTVGVMPITGIPLPFFSYGGSFFVICMICVGLVFRVAWDTKQSGYNES